MTCYLVFPLCFRFHSESVCCVFLSACDYPYTLLSWSLPSQLKLLRLFVRPHARFHLTQEGRHHRRTFRHSKSETDPKRLHLKTHTYNFALWSVLVKSLLCFSYDSWCLVDVFVFHVQHCLFLSFLFVNVFVIASWKMCFLKLLHADCDIQLQQQL